MLYKPDLFVYLWFLPVFVIFIAPFLLLPAALLRDKILAAKSQLLGVRAFTEIDERESNGVEKRKHPRKVVDGFVAHVSDGVNFCNGAVLDVSKNGICFVNTGDQLNRKADKLGVLLTGPGKSFQMQVKPVWNLKNGLKQNVGATIEDSLWNWEEFEQHLEGAQAVA